MADTVRVLHVDDDREFAELTAEFLRREDDRFDIETETSVSAGLDCLADGGFDCVVSDYRMPGMDGLAFIDAVRAERPNLPFILFTGEGSEDIASEAISRGVTDYLQKGTDTERYALLANRITNAVEQFRARRRAAEQRRISTVVREVNEALVHARTAEEVDERVCEVLADADPYRLAWIGDVDPETNRIEPRTAAGIGTSYPDEITVTADDTPTGRGPGGTAVREGRVAVSQDVSEDDSFAPWRDAAEGRGYRAVAAIPLTHDGDRYGLLCVYADRPNAFTDSERTLLAELGETIGHAHRRIAAQRAYTDQYAHLFEEAPVMFATTRNEGGEPVIEDCNRAFAGRIGADRADLRGTPLADLYAEESARDLLDRGGYERALDGEFLREKRVFRTRDGDRLETLLRAVPRRDRDGTVVGTHALYVDVTDHDRMRELETMRERIQFALEATDSIVYEIDLDSLTETRHGPFERLYGVPSDQLQSTEAFYEHGVHPDDRERLERLQLREVFEADADTFEIEYRTHPDHGPVRWLRSESYLRTDDDGEPRTLVGLATDVTERKRRERELERQNERLDTFARVVSHDLRNPLDVLAGSLELAEETGDETHFDRGHRAVDRMEQLIDDLLTLARDGAAIDDTEPVALAAMVAECWDTVETADAELRVDTDLTVRADPGRLRQMVENLFRNSVEHGSTSSRTESDDSVEHGSTDNRTESGDSVEHGSTSSRTESDDSVEHGSTDNRTESDDSVEHGRGEPITVTVGDCEGGFYVADDGVGIPEDERERIFEAGYSTGDDGTGFGLMIVTEIADAHGWTVTVGESADGGARFEVTGVDAVS